MNSYIFRHQTVIFREPTQNKQLACWTRVVLVHFVKTGSPVPKHAGVDIYHALNFKIGILLDFKECISWLIYLTRLIYAFLKFDVLWLCVLSMK